MAMTSAWFAYGASGIMNGSIDLDTSTLKAMLVMTNTSTDTEDKQIIGPAATNIVANPSFETDTSSWSAVATGSIARITTDFSSGVACLEVTNSAINDGVQQSITGNATQSQAYTLSFYLKAKTAADVGKNVQFFLQSVGGTFEIPITDTVASTAAWVRVTATGTWANASHTGCVLIIRSVTSTSSFLIDAVQYETGSVATPYGAVGFTTLDEMDGSGYARVTLSGGTVTGDLVNHRGEITFSDIRFSGVAAGTRQVQGVLIYKHVTNDADSIPIAYMDGDSAGVLPFTANGGDIVIASPVEGLLRVSR